MPLPDDVRADELDEDVRKDLSSLAPETADTVARHLVVAGLLLDDDPQRALDHARAAGALAGRLGVVRETVGLAAYRAGEWAEALSELRAARRITGSTDHLAVMADCERALGRPERALAHADDPQAATASQAARVELALVVAGARRDLGQPDAAVLLLQGPARATTARRPWAARLWYAYADALLDAGREAEAREWFAKTVEVDPEGETDADERLLELEGVVFDDSTQADRVADDEAETGLPQDRAPQGPSREHATPSDRRDDDRSDDVGGGPDQDLSDEVSDELAEQHEQTYDAASLAELVAGMVPLSVARPSAGDAADSPPAAAAEVAVPAAEVPTSAATSGAPAPEVPLAATQRDVPGAAPASTDAGHQVERPRGLASPFAPPPGEETPLAVAPTAVPAVAFVAAEPDPDVVDLPVEGEDGGAREEDGPAGAHP